MRPPIKVPNSAGEGVARKSYFSTYDKTANAKVSRILGKHKLSTPAVKGSPASSAPVSDVSSDAAGTYAKTPQPFRVSFGDTGEQADDLE